MYDRLQGVLPQPIGEGTHFRVPWFQTPNVMDIRTRPRSISSVTGTKGLQRGQGPAVDVAPRSGVIASLLHRLLTPRVRHRRSSDGQHHAARAVEAGRRDAAAHLQGGHPYKSLAQPLDP